MASKRDDFPRAQRDPDEGLRRIGTIFGGVMDDYRRRFPLYRSDIADSMTRKTISSALFMFFATFASTVALGVVIKRNTKCDATVAKYNDCRIDTDDAPNSFLGVTEYLLMNSLAGMAHSLLGCQPLLVLRPTGPITAFISLLFAVAKTLELNFLHFLGWTGIFVGLYMTLVAAFEISRFIKLLTRFLHDIFAFFVCSIYVVDGVMGVIGRFNKAVAANHAADDPSQAEALFALLLTAVLLAIAFTLNRMDRSSVLSRTANLYLVDYALTIATFVVIGISYATHRAVSVERIDLPPVTGVAMNTTLVDANGHHRPWATALGDATGSSIGAGAIAAIPIVIFFFFDQNVSSLLCQQENMHLRKGSYFHSSFLCMGIFDIISPAFGLPFVTGSLPHSPQLVRALEAAPAETAAADRSGGGNSDGDDVFVWENRLSPFLMYFLIGAALWFPVGRSAIEAIPDAAVDGILIFVGIAGLFECQLWDRIWLFCTQERFYPRASFTRVEPRSKMHAFTMVQLASLGFAWLLNGLAMGNPSLAPLGLCFPLVIMLLVPFRLYVLPIYFSDDELEQLDNEVDDRVDPALHKRSRSRSASFGTRGQVSSNALLLGADLRTEA